MKNSRLNNFYKKMKDKNPLADHKIQFKLCLKSSRLNLDCVKSKPKMH